MSGQPESAEPSRADLTRLRQVMRRWRAVAIGLGVLVVVLFGLTANQEPPAPVVSAGAATAVQAADNPTADQYATEQAKSEIRLLRRTLKEAHAAVEYGRHHSLVMWELLDGKISSTEAWWQGGDSTCAGWLAANEFEIAEAKLKGRQARPPPLPKKALKFCKQARERK
jgi:hypothetical protein